MVGEAVISIFGEEHRLHFDLAENPKSGEKRDATVRFLPSDTLGGLVLTQKDGSFSASFGELCISDESLKKMLDAICLLSPFEPTESGITDDGRSFIVGNDGRRLVFSSDGRPEELYFENIYVKIVWIEL